MSSVQEIKYLGFVFAKCDWDRERYQSVSKMKIGIGDINLDAEKHELSITYVIEFCNDNVLVSKMEFQAWFLLDNMILADEILKISSNPSRKMTHELSNALLMMVHLSFPFVRQAVFNMTNDLFGPVNIPIIDSVQLLDGGVEFNRTINE